MTATLHRTALASAALRGDAGSVDALATAWLPTVYAWCHRLGGPGIDAEDAAHEALISMCRNLGRLTAPEAFPSWMFAICRGVVANHRRRAWFRRWIPSALGERISPSDGPERVAQTAETADLVWKILDELSAAHREVLVLCELEERSAADVGLLLGAPTGTVKSRLRLAKEAFRAVAVRRGVQDLAVGTTDSGSFEREMEVADGRP